MLSISSYVPVLSLSDGARRWRRDANPENRKLSLDPKKHEAFCRRKCSLFLFCCAAEGQEKRKAFWTREEESFLLDSVKVLKAFQFFAPFSFLCIVILNLL